MHTHKISFTPLLSQSVNQEMKLAATRDLHKGFNLDTFNQGEESTLDDKIYNVVAEKQFQKSLRCVRRSPDTFTVNTWRSINSSELCFVHFQEQQLSPKQLPELSPKPQGLFRQIVNDFTQQRNSTTTDLLDHSPDFQFSRSVSQTEQSESEPLSFEFSGSDIPTQMLCYTTERQSSSNLQSISESACVEETSPALKQASLKNVKMIVVDSQNIQQRLTAQKRKVVEESNIPIVQKIIKQKVKQPVQKTVELTNFDKTQRRTFRLFSDADIGVDLSKFSGDNYSEPVVDSCQDDDLATDEEVIEAGIQQCFQDLLVMKDCLLNQNERALKTYRVWAPRFNGQLPRLKSFRSD